MSDDNPYVEHDHHDDKHDDDKHEQHHEHADQEVAGLLRTLIEVEVAQSEAPRRCLATAGHDEPHPGADLPAHLRDAGGSQPVQRTQRTTAPLWVLPQVRALAVLSRPRSRPRP